MALPQAGVGDGARVKSSGEVGDEAAGGATAIGRGPGGETAGADATGGVRDTSEVRDSVRRDAGNWRRGALDPHARVLAQRLFEPEPDETSE